MNYLGEPRKLGETCMGKKNSGGHRACQTRLTTLAPGGGGLWWGGGGSGKKRVVYDETFSSMFYKCVRRI